MSPTVSHHGLQTDTQRGGLVLNSAVVVPAERDG
jgi:hypothetical protein